MPEPIIQSVIVDVSAEFEKRVFAEASNEVRKLDEEILKLKKDALSLKETDPAFASLSSKIGQLTKDRNDLSKAMENGSGAIQKQSAALGGLGNAATIAGKAFSALKGLIAISAIVEFTRKAAAATVELERTSLQLQAFGINAQKANQIVKDLNKLAARVPFEGDQLNKSAQKLAAFNVNADDMTKIIEQLSAVAVGSGASLDQLTQAFGRANATGKVTSLDFRSVSKSIPSIVDAIAQSTGKTIEQVKKLGKQGKISFEEFQNAINITTTGNGQFAKVLDKYGESFDSLGKAAKEAGNDILVSFGEGASGGISDGLKDIKKALVDILPLFESLGKIAGVVLRVIGIATQQLASIFGTIYKAIDFIGDGIDRLLGIGNKSQQADALKSFQHFTDEYQKLAGERKNVIKKGTQELTDEEMKALEKSRKQLEAGRRAFVESEKALLDSIAKSVFEIQQKLLVDEGLDLFAEREKIIKESADKANQLNDLLVKNKEDAAKIGTTISQKTIAAFEEAKRLLIESTTNSLNEIDKLIQNRQNVKLQGIDLLIPLNINFNEDQAVSSANASIKKIFDKIVEQNLDFNATNKANKTKNAKAGTSILGRILGIDPNSSTANEDLEKFGKVFKEQLSIFADEATNAANAFINAEVEKTNFLIDETKSRLDKLLSVQEGGNATQIRLEQQRLDTLLDQREKHLQRQKVIDAAQIVANNALSASNSIRAITAAFAEGGNPVVGIAASLALVATIGATIASLSAQFNSIPKFWEGAERVGDKSKATRSGRDGHLIWADGGERIIPTKFNDMIPNFVKNSDLPSIIDLGLRAVSGTGMNDRNITREQRETNRLLKANQKLLKNQTIKLKVIGNDSEKLRLKRMHG